MYMNVAPQTWMFLLSCLLGAFLGLFYDLFRIIRIAFPPSKVSLLIEDILFGVAALFFTFLFLQTVTSGSFRLFVLIGEILGFTVYYLTVGVLVFKAAHIVISAVKRVLKWICRVLILPAFSFFQRLFRLLSPIAKKGGAFFKKSAAYLKKGLHFLPDLLYNTTIDHKKRKRKHYGKKAKNKKG